MKRALLAAGLILLLLALVVGAFRAITGHGNPGPFVVPVAIGTSWQTTVDPDLVIGESDPPIIFGRRFPQGNRNDSLATILVFDGVTEAREVILSEEFRGLGWVHAARSRDRRTVWAFADNWVESPGWTLELVTSTDGGASWRHLSTVPKPYYYANFESFQMDHDGVGQVAMRLDTGAPIRAADVGVFSRLLVRLRGERYYGDEQPAGLYVYRTKNGGLTWSGPTYIDDDTHDATGPGGGLFDFEPPEP